MNQSFERFQGVADRYALYRPHYPAGLLHGLRDAILGDSAPRSGIVIDVGCGTGIFTRQLAAVLRPDIQIVGVEPAAAMRAKAAEDTQGVSRLRYVEGTAEHLPFDGETARAVVTATAAHWFDRPLFYAECRRVLNPVGVLAIVQYLRDVDGSPAAAALTEFMARYGGPKAYVRPDYPAELDALSGFGEVTASSEAMTIRIDAEAFVGLALSSSHARAVQAALGEDETERALYHLADELADADGAISYGYIFQSYLTRRI
jgi:ubiquinone/menaquinone biosynthesis C-methylase UbiE